MICHFAISLQFLFLSLHALPQDTQQFSFIHISFFLHSPELAQTLQYLLLSLHVLSVCTSMRSVGAGVAAGKIVVTGFTPHNFRSS